MDEELKAEWKDVEDEPEEVNSLETRAQLVAKIEALKLNCLDMGKASFSITVNKLRILNLDLNTKGIGLGSKIADRKLIPREPEDDKEEEEEKRGSSFRACMSIFFSACVLL